ncbi:MAG: hypothetical protein Q8N94_01260 [Methanoregula sp.]|nr:hypothetical protein [Methanoregula sp.]
MRVGTFDPEKQFQSRSGSRWENFRTVAQRPKASASEKTAAAVGSGASESMSVTHEYDQQQRTFSRKRYVRSGPEQPMAMEGSDEQ